MLQMLNLISQVAINDVHKLPEPPRWGLAPTREEAERRGPAGISAGTVAPFRGPQCQPLFVSRDILGEALCESVYSIVATRPIVKAPAGGSGRGYS
jgi:hypothetical protein